jgi:pimeloyl-ACP methyl ester carboxylesterase
MANLSSRRQGLRRTWCALCGAAKALCVAAFLLASTVAAALPAVLAPSQLGDGTAVDGEALGTRLPLVLVHGLGGSPDGWDNFLQAYGRNATWRAAFKPYSFRYSSTTAEVNADPSAPHTITGVGAQLRDAIQQFYDRPTAAPDFGFGRKSIVILAHSMGGLVARSMMQEYAFSDGQRGGQKVLHLITLGSPHQGSPLADAALVLGVNTVSELSDTHADFLKQLTWTNYDGLNMFGGRCNPWLAQMNTYWPASSTSYGNCGRVPANPLPGFYEKIIAYGTGALQQKDYDPGTVGVYKPGSSNSLDYTHWYLLNMYARPYANDGIVPMAGAQFAGGPLLVRRSALACDHRYLKNGYTEFVRTAAATYTDQAFCSAESGMVTPSGVSGGFAWLGSIFGDPGGIIETIRWDSQAERVFDWAEQAYAAALQPAGAATALSDGYSYRFYPASNAYVGTKDGNVYYMGPASNGAIQFMGTLADFLARASADGF